MTEPAAAKRGERAGRVVNADQASLGELVTNLSRDLTTLMRQELALARAELSQETQRTAQATGVFAMAAVAGGLTLLFVSLAAWWKLSTVIQPGWAALVLATLWLAVALPLYLRGARMLRVVRRSLTRAENHEPGGRR
jgi:hypothetical protein